MEDNDRTRAASIAYLQNWLGNFYPERMDIVNEARKLAESMGGQLHTPRLSWKYSWIDPIFGRIWAKRAQVALPRLRWSVARSLDKALFKIEHNKPAANPASARV